MPSLATRRKSWPVPITILTSLIVASSAFAAPVVTAYQRNAPAWKSAQPRYVGFAFDQRWPSRGASFLGCNVVGQPDSTAAQTLQLVGGQVTVTARDSSGNRVCPFVDGTSSLLASDANIVNGGTTTFEFSPPISAFYANYGSLAVGHTCTMSLYAQGMPVDAITTPASTHQSLAIGHGFASPVLIDEIRFTCTEAGTVLIGSFVGLNSNTLDNIGSVCVPAYDSNCSGPSYTRLDMACVFEGPDFTVALPGVSGDPDDFIAVPRGRPIYALLVSGYSQNAGFNLLHYFNFANFVIKEDGYVHYAWWNNLLAPYMERRLHLPQSHPGNLETELGGFVPKPGPNGFFSQKALPEEDHQFQSDALRFIRAVRQAEPNAILVVVGHSMGGGAVARLGSATDVTIDILAPIDPVGNRSLPVGRVGHKDYNWTRWRAIHGEFNGFKDQDCDRNFLGFCKLPLNCFPIGNWRDAPPGPNGGWSLTAPTCGAHVHNPAARKLSSKVLNLYHRWQTEAAFPFDYNTNRLFNFTPPAGGKNDQKAVVTCASGTDPIDPSFNCGPLDGHGEIVGFRNINPLHDDALRATSWTSSAATRKNYLIAWETEGDAWGHRPTKPNLCLVSDGLISMLNGLIAGADAAVVAEKERKTLEWKAAVPGRWEGYAFDQSWPSGGSNSFTGCNIVGVPDPTAPRTLQLSGGTITVTAKNAANANICPIQDGTNADRTSEGMIANGGTLILDFNPPIGAFCANYGSLAVGATVRMNLYAGAELVDYVVSPKSPAASNGVEAIGHGFISPRLIDRIEFTSTEAGTVLLGAFRGALGFNDDLGSVCITAYDPTCAGPTFTPYDLAVVFGPGSVVNQTLPGAPFYFTIGAAIEAAQDGDEILAAAGVYAETVNFSGKAVTLRGAGATHRGGAPSVIDASGLEASAVTCAGGEGPDTVLDGFVVTGGFGTSHAEETRGGGMYNNASHPTVINCTFTANHADRGGGMYNLESNPTVVDCLFSANTATLSGAGMDNDAASPALSGCTFEGNDAGDGTGGGLSNANGGNPVVRDCMFTANFAGDGAGLYNADGAPTILRTVFEGNVATGDGGGLMNVASDTLAVSAAFVNNSALRGGGWFEFGGAPALTNVLFAGNEVAQSGGGMFIDGAAGPLVAHGTFSENLAAALGGGVRVGDLSTLTVVNSIFWNNASSSLSTTDAQVDVSPGGSVLASFSIIADDDPGAGTIPFGGADAGISDRDPRFVNPQTGNYRLKPTSPAVDAGSNADVPADAADLDADADTDELTPLDLDGLPRFVDADGAAAARVDLGPFEFDGCRGNFDTNTAVDLADLAAMVDCMEQGIGAAPACRDVFDFDSDEYVRLRDFRVLQLNFSCSP